MSVTAIRLKNFMAFEDTDWIELRPITVLFGKNSSGKSVISRALRFLKQSLKAEPGSGPFIYRTRDGVDVGMFETMLHHGSAHSDSSLPTITFAFRCTLSTTLDALWRLVNEHYQGIGLTAVPSDQFQGAVEFSLKYEWDDLSECAWLTGIEIALPHSSALESAHLIVFAAEWLGNEAVAEGEDVWHFSTDILHCHESDQEPAWSGSSVSLMSGFLPTIRVPPMEAWETRASTEDLDFVAHLLDELRDQVREYLERIDYLGPLRPEPTRDAVLGMQDLADWQDSGLRSYLALLSGNIDQSLKAKIDLWCQAIGLCCRVDPDVLGYAEDRGLFSGIDIIESPQSRPTRLIDVGFGLSQVLPVIVAAVLTRGKTTVLIEQPELHLHPRAQSSLADVFVENTSRVQQLIRQRESENQARPSSQQLELLSARFLIETHSEHLLLRLRHHIARTTLNQLKRARGIPLMASPDIDPSLELRLNQLAVYYVERFPERQVSVIEPVPLDERGQYITRPEGFKTFFSDDFEQVMGINQDIADITSLENDRAAGY